MKTHGMSGMMLKRHKNILIIIMIGLFLIELEIFAVAMMKSGRQSRIHVLNTQGDVIYQTDGEKLSRFNKYYFENTFGSFDKYNKKLVVKEIPFPFRAWFTAAVGIPLGGVLLLAFIYKAYFTMVTEKDDDDGLFSSENVSSGGFYSVVKNLERMNIFVTGFFILLAVLAYWIVPNLISFLAKAGADTISRNKWFFISAALAVFFALIWIIYLKYKLAARGIDARVELHKYQYKLQVENGLIKNNSIEYDGEPLLIEADSDLKDKEKTVIL